MIKYFITSADVYLLSGIWLLAYDHCYTGAFCILFSIIDGLSIAAKERK